MGRALRIGLHSPYFGSVYGGGERYLGVAAEAMRDGFPGHRVEIVAPVPVDEAAYRDRLGLDLSGIALRASNPRVTPLHRLAARAPLLRGARNRFVAWQAARVTSEYDLWVAMAYVIPVRSRARGAAVLCQFPFPLDGRRRQDLERFQLVVCQSEYVRSWVRRLWDRDAAVVNPPVDVPAGPPDWSAKRSVILSVGRFVAGGHNKRHDVLVEAFRALCEGGLSGWELHLAGSAHGDPESVRYLARVRDLARGYPVHLHTDLPLRDLHRLYSEASIYWHAAGWGADPEAEPEKLEHFGMTTVEAMGRGAVPVVFGHGGQAEVVEDGKDGFRWTDLEQLRRRTLELVADPELRRRLGSGAEQSSRRWSEEAFRSGIVKVFQPLVEQLARS